MDYFPLVIAAVFVLVGGRFLINRVKYSSWTGAFLKGSINRTVGEVELTPATGMTQTLRVVTLRPDDGPEFVGFVVIAKAPLAASMTPYRLSKSEAQRPASLLSTAST